MIYLDTNILVSLHINDGLTAPAVSWIAEQTLALALSEWVRTEFHAVIGLRKRKDELSAAMAHKAINSFTTRVDDYHHLLPVSNEAATLAADWLRNPDCTLQTGDALHLAIAQRGGASVLATFDARFAKAAQKLRLPNLKIVLIGEKVRRVEQTRAAYSVSAVATSVAKAMTRRATARKKRAAAAG